MTFVPYPDKNTLRIDQESSTEVAPSVTDIPYDIETIYDIYDIFESNLNVRAPGLEPGHRACIRRLLYQLSYARAPLWNHTQTRTAN